jgi:GPH family glycoside/pentoside/hexuronide:cation symporter
MFLFILSFCKPFAGEYLWLYLLGTAMLFRFAYSLIDVPHNSLLGRVQEQGQSVAKLGAMRLGATIAGTLAVIGAAQFAISGAAWHFAAFAIAAGIAGAILFIRFFPFSTLPSSQATANHAKFVPPATTSKALTASAALFISAISATVVNGMFSKDIVYIAKYVLSDPAWTITGLTLFTAGKIAGVPCWVWFSEQKGIVGTMRASFLLIAVVGAGVALTPPAFYYLGTALFFFGIGIAGTNIAGWALMPDCADLFPPNDHPLFFGLFTAANKVASGLSGAIVGYTLAQLGIAGGSSSSESQARGLYWLVYIYPIAGAVLGIGGIAMYRFLRSSRFERPRFNV